MKAFPGQLIKKLPRPMFQSGTPRTTFMGRLGIFYLVYFILFGLFIFNDGQGEFSVHAKVIVYINNSTCFKIICLIPSFYELFCFENLAKINLY